MPDPEVTPAAPSEPDSSTKQPRPTTHNQTGPHRHPIQHMASHPTHPRRRHQPLNRNPIHPSVLSKRYGTLSSEESSSAARQIEDEAFAAASAASDEDGNEILQLYSKEISKRMLHTVKARATTPSPAVDHGVAASDATPSSYPVEEGVNAAAESDA